MTATEGGEPGGEAAPFASALPASGPPPLLETPLASALRRAGARLEAWDGRLVADRFGDPAAEHQHVVAAAGIFDLSSRGLLAMRGASAGNLLQRIFTNDVRELPPGGGQAASFLTPKGKLIAAFHLYRTAEQEFLLVFGEPLREETRRALERYALLEDVAVEDREGSWGILSVQGARAGGCLAAALPAAAPPTEPFVRVPAEWGGAQVYLRRGGATPEGGWEIETPRSLLEPLWEALVRAAVSVGGGPAGQAAAEILRIEAGVPRWGADVDGTNFPNESGYEEAISYTKGCYIGQEVIARMKTYGHVNRRLMALVLPDARAVEKGVRLFREGKEAGSLTSAAVSPRTGRTLALGYLRPHAWEHGTPVAIGSPEAAADAIVADRPPVFRR